MIATRTRMVGTVLALFVLLVGVTGALAVECVKPSGAGPCFPTIQEAVNHASENEVVQIYPGTYEEAVVVDTAGVTLLGMGTTRAKVKIDQPYHAPSVSQSVVTLNADRAAVRHVTLRNGYHGVMINGTGN